VITFFETVTTSLNRDANACPADCQVNAIEDSLSV
jgi:hypothetical protein